MKQNLVLMESGPLAKFRNIKCEADGYKFDSKKERSHYFLLRELERQGQIQNLVLQPKWKFEIDGKPLKHAGKGARQLSYTADFQYVTHEGDIPKLNVVDVKSKITAKEPKFIIKKALMWTLYGIDVQIVY